MENERNSNDKRDNRRDERPLRTRPLMPNVAELAGEHRGERQKDEDDDEK